MEIAPKELAELLGNAQVTGIEMAQEGAHVRGWRVKAKPDVPDSMVRERNNLRELRDQLEAENKGLVEQVRVTNIQIATRTGERDEYKKQLAEAWTEREKNNGAWNDTCQVKDKVIDRAEQAQAVAEKLVESLRRENDQLQTDHDTLAERVTELKSEREDLGTELEQWKTAAKNMEGRFSESQEEAVRLNDELERLRSRPRKRL